MKDQKFLAVFSLVLVTTLSSCADTSIQSPDNSDKTDTPPQIEEIQNDTSAQVDGLTGDFSQEISYSSPGGLDKVSFSLSVENGTVKSLSVKDIETNHESAEYNERFNRKAKGLAGKSLSEVKGLSAIGGASLTTGAFKEFLSKI